MARHTGSSQILFLGSCPLLNDQKISLITLAILLPDTVSLGFGFKSIIIFQKNM